MKESLVQWTLLNNQAYLSECLDFPISRKIGQEITTEFGRIDFVLENDNQQQLIVELETVLNTTSKLQYCFDQITRYQKVKFADDTRYCILFANETSTVNSKRIEKFGRENDIIIRSYSLDNATNLYAETVKRLSLNVGLAMPTPKNYTICFLRWLNKILKPFHDLQKQEITFDEIFSPFNSKNGSKTNFMYYKRLALDFEMLEEHSDFFSLTSNGEIFINNFSPFIFRNNIASSIDLTNEQKRLLLKILTNGNWNNKIHKMNIYWFLRFIEVTNGGWLPKRYPFDNDKLEIARGLFGVSYNFRTMQEFLRWCCNYCEELGLVETIRSTTLYDRLVLTPLGVDVSNIFSMDLSLKRSRMNLSFKYSE